MGGGGGGEGGIAARYLWNAARCQCVPHFDKCKCTLIADAVNTNSSDVSAILDHSVIVTNKTIASQIGVNGTPRHGAVWCFPTAGELKVPLVLLLMCLRI